MMGNSTDLQFEVEYLDEDRKVVLNGVVLTDEEIEREEDQRVIMYDLFIGAQSLKAAKKMESERHEYFQSLYDFSYGVVNLSDEPVFFGSTESRALQIIDEKGAYDRRISKLKTCYFRFRALLSRLNENDEQLLRNYFEHGYKVNYEALRESVTRLSPSYIKEEQTRERALDNAALKDYYKQVRSLQKDRAIEDPNEGKQQYLIKGRFVYMTEDEYQSHLQEKEASMNEYKELFSTGSQYTANQSSNAI